MSVRIIPGTRPPKIWTFRYAGVSQVGFKVGPVHTFTTFSRGLGFTFYYRIGRLIFEIERFIPWDQR